MKTNQTATSLLTGLLCTAGLTLCTQPTLAAPGDQPGQAKEVAHDDGASAGKRSMAGSGHAVRFEAGGKDMQLTGVRVYGSRYGQTAPPNENAYVWLCDADFKLISAFPVPYSTFPRGQAGWITIPIKPTRVPEKFIIAVGFNPTATKGVYVHYDATSSGNSLSGLPGRGSKPFETGDWMIRVMLSPAEASPK